MHHHIIARADIEVVYFLFRALHHQVNIQRKPGDAVQQRHKFRAKAIVGDEIAVHDIHMKHIRPQFFQFTHMGFQPFQRAAGQRW